MDTPIRTSTRLIWTAAGRPSLPSAGPASSVCWWCMSTVSRGVAVASMPSTFLDACGRDAPSPSSTHLCEPCAWTLSDAVRLPREVGGPLLSRALAGEGEHPGRVAVAVGDEAPARRLVLRLTSGQVGVWERSGRPHEETGWARARTAMADTPMSLPGCAYLGAFDEHQLAERVGGKFRNFIVYADDAGTWRMWTKADRRAVRGALCWPPDAPWTLAIGDGQKHAAIYAPVNERGAKAARIHLEGYTITYRPHDLRRLLKVVEELLAAGVRREQIETGRYLPSDEGAVRAVWTLEPAVSPWRGGLLELALWLACRASAGLPLDEGSP